MSLIRCGMFISLTAETARAGAAAIPACKPARTMITHRRHVISVGCSQGPL